MAEPGKLQDQGPRLYLEDLHAGRRFTSAAHLVDEAQIRRLPLSSIRSRSTSMPARRRPRCSAGWRPVWRI